MTLRHQMFCLRNELRVHDDVQGIENQMERNESDFTFLQTC